MVDSGETAVAYLEKHTVDLVVLDMIMGEGMDGLDTYRAISALHPGQKAIIASGFAETDRVRKAQQLGAGAYVKKPFLMEALALGHSPGTGTTRRPRNHSVCRRFPTPFAAVTP